ncbi:hypothetical protein AVEN_201513-1 [Araneus ventricosus]|uniref:Uncharacterized protein n=1 Tax=Araneus ventricosus TaxID=182803 RepID=A0A4Y2PWL1_ARAVE|nr:hypothetical protein AVEN_201513-1 [Araneus ventricosus]
MVTLEIDKQLRSFQNESSADDVRGGRSKMFVETVPRSSWKPFQDVRGSLSKMFVEAIPRCPWKPFRFFRLRPFQSFDWLRGNTGRCRSNTQISSNNITEKGLKENKLIL